MPFQSEKQRRYLWANEPEIARDWTDTYGSGIAKALGGRIPFANGLNYLKNIGSNVMGGANWLADRASNVIMNQAPNRYLDYQFGTGTPVTDLRQIAPTRSTQDVLMSGIASNIGRKGYDFSNPFSSVIQSKGGGREHGSDRIVDYGGYKLGNPLKGGTGTEVGQMWNTILGGSAENQIANTLGDYTVNYNPSTQLGPQVTPESMNIFDRYDFKGKKAEGRGTPYDINVNLSPQMIEKIKGKLTDDDETGTIPFDPRNPQVKKAGFTIPPMLLKWAKARAQGEGIGRIRAQIQAQNLAKKKAAMRQQVADAEQQRLQARVTAQANRGAAERVARGEARDYGHTQTRSSSGWRSDPMAQGGLAWLR